QNGTLRPAPACARIFSAGSPHSAAGRIHSRFLLPVIRWRQAARTYSHSSASSGSGPHTASLNDGTVHSTRLCRIRIRALSVLIERGGYNRTYKDPFRGFGPMVVSTPNFTPLRLNFGE